MIWNGLVRCLESVCDESVEDHDCDRGSDSIYTLVVSEDSDTLQYPAHRGSLFVAVAFGSRFC